MNDNFYENESYENDSYVSNFEFQDYSDDKDSELYNDGDDKKPKIFIIIGIIIVIIIFLLLFIVACSKINKKSSNSYLKTLSVSKSELSPKFDKKTLKYSALTGEEMVTVYCSADSSKASTSGCNKKVYLTESCSEHEINVTAQDGSKKTYIVNICKADSNSPIIKSIDVSPSKYTNEDVTVKINAESEIPLNEEAYSIDGGETWQSSNEFVISDNTTLNIVVRNEIGGEATQTKIIKNIDKTSPTVELIGTTPSGVESSSNVVLTANISPFETISGYSFKWYKNGTLIKNANKSSYTTSSSGKYSVVVSTGSGNSVSSTQYEVVIKSSGKGSSSSGNKGSSSSGSGGSSSSGNKGTSGSGNSSSSSSNSSYSLSFEVHANNGSWTKDPVTLTIKNVKSSVGLADKPYSFDGGVTWQSSNSKLITQSGRYSIIVKDKQGNNSNKNILVDNIDNVVPKIKVTNSNGTLKVTVENASSIKSPISYEWFSNGKSVKKGENSYNTNHAAGSYYVVVSTESGHSTKSEVITIAASVQPTATIKSSSTDWTSNDVTLTANVSNGTAKSYVWYKGSSPYSKCNSKKCVISDSGKAKYKVKITTTDDKTVEASSTVLIDKTSSISISKITGSKVGDKLVPTMNPANPPSGYTKYVWKNSKEVVVSNSKEYTPKSADKYSLTVQSGAGKEATKTVSVKASTASISSNKTGWTSEKVTLTLTVNDKNNVKSITWYHSTSGASKGSKGSVSSCGKDYTCTVGSSDLQTKYYAIVTMKNGEVITTNDVDVLVDKAKPEVKISGDKWTGGTLKVTATPTSTKSGNVKYQWYKDGSKISNATSGTYKTSKSGKYYCIVRTVAGTEVKSSPITVGDITASIKASTSSWTSGNVKLTITVTNGTFKSATWYYGDGSKSSCDSSKSTCTISVNANTSYYAKVVTKEGKTITTNKVNVKIDKTNPSVSISRTCNYVGCKLTGSASAKSGIASCYWYKDSTSSSSLSSSSTYTPKVAAKYIYRCKSNSGLYGQYSVSVGW